jgi:hypothetical protein
MSSIGVNTLSEFPWMSAQSHYILPGLPVNLAVQQTTAKKKTKKKENSTKNVL